MSSTIANLLKTKRKELKLSVSDVLETLKTYEVNISDKTLYSWESGHRQPDADTSLILCHIYGVDSISEILGHEKEWINLSLDEQAIIEDYRSVNEQGKELIRQQVELVAASNKYKKSCDLPDVGNEA